MSSRPEPELGPLRKQAEDLAARRHEPATGAHLLAALAATPGAVSDVLIERGASARQILNALDALADRGPDENLQAFVRRARELAHRMDSQQLSPAHLLMALLNETRGTSRRCLEHLGVDASRLRTAAVQLGMGIIGRRRIVGADARDVEPALPPSLPAPAPSGPRGTAVPLVPQLALRSAPSDAARQPGVALPTVPQVGPAPLARLRAAGAEATSKASARAGETRAEDADESPRAPVAPSSPAPAAASHSAAATDAELRFGLDERRFPILTQIGKNLTLAAARGEFDPVVGRDAEIEQALDVLAKRQGNNPCLVGPAGVGKTSVARGLAASIAARRDVASLDDRILIEIPIAELVAGTGVRGALAGRLAALRKEVRAAGRVVLFFDEIHLLFAGDGVEEIAADLKLALSRGELPCVGATTVDEYRRFIDSDSALSRRFTVVEVEEPTREDAYLVLESVARKLERHHRVGYDDEALALTINWSMRYLPGRALPDKAVSIVDLAGARARRRGAERVTPEAVAEVIAGLAGMPVERLLESDGDRMLRLEEILSERVIGHGEHMGKIARILRRNAAGLGSRRPIGTFLLLGPTGVGKTETAKAIAEVLFHTESAMTRIDMSELSEAHAVAKLIGAPPGYVGHDAGGQLTEAVRRRPYQVVLLDEIEKAHPEVLTAFLAVFDEGRMSDGRGRTVDFTNTVIVLTSNLGASELGAASQRRVGFSRAGGGTGAVDVDARVVGAARAALPPELYNRLDEVLAFSPLGRDDVRRIAEKMLCAVSRSLEEKRDVRLDVDAAAIELLLDRGGFDPELGARPMRRTLARLVEAPLAEKILRGELCAGDVVLLGVEDDELCFDVLDETSSAAQ